MMLNAHLIEAVFVADVPSIAHGAVFGHDGATDVVADLVVAHLALQLHQPDEVAEAALQRSTSASRKQGSEELTHAPRQ